MKFSKNISFMFTLLYSVNPLFVHAVAWVPARNDLLIAVFCLLSFYYYLKYSEEKRIIYFIIHISAYLLALFSKETVILFPVILILYQIMFKIKSKNTLLYYISWGFSIRVWMIIRTLSIGYDFSSVDASFIVLIKNFLVIPEIVSKFILPYNLPNLSVFNLYRIIFGIIVIIFVACSIKKSNKTNRIYVTFGIIWLLVLILPGSFARHPYADQFYDYLDHRSYLPMFGFLIAIISLIGNNANIMKNKYLYNIIYAVIVVFALITFFRLDSYKNSIDFWKKSIKDNPDKGMNYSELAINYQKIGMIDSAEKYLLISKNLFPLYYNNYRALGQLYSDKKDYLKEIDMLKKSLELKPELVDQKMQLGFAYYKTNNFNQAVKEWNELKNISGENKLLLINLFEGYLSHDILDTAEIYANKLLKMNEKGPIIKLYSVLFKNYYISKNYTKAIEYGNQLKLMNYKNIAVYKNLSACYVNIGNKQSAESVLLECKNKFPNELEIYYIILDYYLKENNYYKAKIISKDIILHGGKLDNEIMQLINK
jgi:protein O-mannosyl-transferase